MNQSLSALPKLAVVSLLCAAAFPAAAQSAGNTVLQVGWFHLAPNDDSEPLTRTFPGPTTQIAGSGASISNSDTLGLALTYFATDNLAFTADVGVPPKFKLDGEGSLAPLGQLGSAKQWSPAIIAKWYFGDAQSKFRPFVGIGVTHVWYTDVKLSRSLQTLSAGPTGTAKASLSTSWEPVANVGAVYNIDKKWSVGFSVSYVPLETRANITGRSAGGAVVSRSTTKLTIDPVVTFLSLGYTF